MLYVVRLLSVVLLVLLPLAVRSDVPMLLNYQGNLTNSSGVAADGPHTMTFCMWDAETGGSQLPVGTPWCETQSVQVTDGVFNVLLGSSTTLPTDLFEGGPTDGSGPLRFLAVTVNGETLAPRRRIVSAAFAIHTQGSPDISARVYCSANISIPSGTLKVLDFDAERWDNGDLFDSANATRLTAPVTGKYFIYGHVRFASNASGYRTIQIALTDAAGSDLGAIASMDAGAFDDTRLSVTSHHKLEVGQYAELQVVQNTGGPLDVLTSPGENEDYCDFGMVKVP